MAKKVLEKDTTKQKIPKNNIVMRKRMILKTHLIVSNITLLHNRQLTASQSHISMNFKTGRKTVLKGIINRRRTRLNKLSNNFSCFFIAA